MHGRLPSTALGCRIGLLDRSQKRPAVLRRDGQLDSARNRWPALRRRSPGPAVHAVAVTRRSAPRARPLNDDDGPNERNDPVKQVIIATLVEEVVMLVAATALLARHERDPRPAPGRAATLDECQRSHTSRSVALWVRISTCQRQRRGRSPPASASARSPAATGWRAAGAAHGLNRAQVRPSEARGLPSLTTRAPRIRSS
jgi:hypothetical protein